MKKDQNQSNFNIADKFYLTKNDSDINSFELKLGECPDDEFLNQLREMSFSEFEEFYALEMVLIERSKQSKSITMDHHMDEKQNYARIDDLLT